MKRYAVKVTCIIKVTLFTSVCFIEYIEKDWNGTYNEHTFEFCHASFAKPMLETRFQKIY